MPVNRNKLFTFLGFSIRKGALVRGVNALKACRKPVYAILLCRSASDNTVSEVQSLCRKRGLAPILVDDLETLAQKTNCRVAAVTDPNLAKAVISVAKEQTNVLPPNGGEA